MRYCQDNLDIKALFKAVIALALQVDDLDVRGSCHQRFNNTLFFIWLL